MPVGVGLTTPTGWLGAYICQFPQLQVEYFWAEFKAACRWHLVILNRRSSRTLHKILY
jgi:hypothetical protein